MTFIPDYIADIAIRHRRTASKCWKNKGSFVLAYKMADQAKTIPSEHRKDIHWRALDTVFHLTAADNLCRIFG